MQAWGPPLLSSLQFDSTCWAMVHVHQLDTCTQCTDFLLCCVMLWLGNSRQLPAPPPALCCLQLWFQLALLILTVLVVIGGRALSIFRPAILALLAVEVALCTLGTDRALTLRDAAQGNSALSSR